MIYLIRTLFKIFEKKQKIKFILILILIFFSLILETFGIGIILPIINLLVTKNKTIGIEFIDKIFSNFSLKEVFFFYLFLFLIFFIIKNIIVSMSIYLQMKIIYEIKKSFSLITFNQFLYKNYKYYIGKNSSFFLHKLGQSINDFTSCVQFVFNSITDTLFIIILLSLLLFIKPTITILIIIFILVPTQIFVFIRKKKQSNDGLNKSILEEKNIKNIQQTISGIREVKLLKLEKFFFNIFNYNIEKICNYETRQHFFSAVPRLLIELCAIMFMVGGFFLYSIKYFDEILFVIPSIAVFTAAAFRLIPSLSRTVQGQQMMNFYRPVVENILNEFRGKNYNYMQYVIKNQNLKKRPKEIIIKNLSYNHDDNKKVFENYTTRIKLKKLIGISGKTGSGKSTLIDLISGFLNPSNGSILINNQNIFSNSKLLSQWQNMIGYVPQTINIFDDTLENNIALGQSQDQINQSRLNKVIKICGLEQFIASKKDKLKTILGDRGAKISGGQKQKIGIARALYFNPKILILDESTNALDEINEEKIINNLILDKELISIFLITHKKKLIKKCNEVINIKTI